MVPFFLVLSKANSYFSPKLFPSIMNRLTAFLLLFFLFLHAANAGSVDSVYIEGRVLNLTARLYRQAPSIRFSRNNILQPASELTRQAALEADGSFKVALPLAFDQEEVYIDYGGKVYATFLASPGKVGIVFDADSLFKTKKLFYFSGINAEANNQYSRYVMEEDRLLKASKVYGSGFTDQFFSLGLAAARRLAQERAQYRLGALKVIESTEPVSPVLINWVTAIVEEERLANLYEYALAKELPLDADNLEGLHRLNQSPLTLQRIEWKNRLDAYAQRALDLYLSSNPSRASALSITLIAQLIKNYVTPLSIDEKNRLQDIIANESKTKEDVDFLSKLYGRNSATMDLLTDFEKKNKIYRSFFPTNIVEILTSQYVTKHFYRLNLDRQRLIRNYVSPKIESQAIRTSFNELYDLEVKDSTLIRLIEARKDIQRDPKEVLPGIWMATSDENGRDWLRYIESLFKGNTLYITKWNLGDDESRNELALLPALQANTNADVVYVFLHIGYDTGQPIRELWKQYIVRNNIRGIHLFVNDIQAAQMNRINALTVPSFAAIRPDGKVASKNALAPSSGRETALFLERISQGN